MKQSFLLLAFAISSLQLLAIDASISFARFQTTEQSYVEIYLHLAGETVNYITKENGLQASVEVLILLQQGETIIQFDKYNLNSPLVSLPTDFVDMKRFALTTGTYNLRVEIKDNNKPENEAKYTAEVSINPEEKLSDIQLLANVERASDAANPFIKHGFILEPLPYNFYNKQAEKMWFYSELYGDSTVLGEKRIVRYYLERLENNKSQALEVRSKQKTIAPLVPVLLGMEIKNLASGNYNLVLELRDETEQLLSKKSIFFQRSNPYLNIENIPLTDDVLQEKDIFVNTFSDEELEYSLRALLPKVPLGDSDRLVAVIQGSDKKAKQLYLLNYWLQENPNLPEKAYAAYMRVVHAVDNTFKSGFRNGFETDRGNIYLKYGRPDDMINVVDDPSAPPYEIWSYNDFPSSNQTNVRFLFYNPTLAGGDFILLHSTALGEINNPQWEVELYRDAPNEIQGNDPFSATQMQDNVGRRAREYFTDF